MKISDFSEQDKEKIISQYNSGVSLSAIAASYGCSRKPIRRIVVDSGTTIRTNDESIRKYSANYNYFDNIDTPNKAYILGFLYADGCNYMNNSTFTYHWILQLNRNDREILERMKNELEYSGPISDTTRFDHNMNRAYSTLYICGRHMCEALDRCGVSPRKTTSTTFPEWLQTDLIPHFIRGLMDGDGCINNIGAASISGNADLIIRVSEIVEKMSGAKNSIYIIQNDARTHTCRMCGKENSKKFLDWVYADSDLKLQRKYERYVEMYC